MCVLVLALIVMTGQGGSLFNLIHRAGAFYVLLPMLRRTAAALVITIVVGALLSASLAAFLRDQTSCQAEP